MESELEKKTEKIVDLDVTFSVDDYVRGLTFVQNRGLFGRYGFIAVPLFIVIVFLITAGMQSGNLESSFVLISLAPAFFIFVLLLFLKYFPNPILKWHVKRQFASSPLLQEKQFVSFSEVGIKGHTNLSSAETKWEGVIEAAETSTDLFFFTSKKFAMFVPKSNLTSSQIDGIKELAKSNLGEKANF